MHENELLWCSYCGRGVRNNAKENASYGKKPYPHDNEFGLCRKCGGDPQKLEEKDLSALTEAELKEVLGWETTMFFESRFKLVRENLKPENQKKWDKTTFVQKVYFVQKMIDKGIIAW